MFFSDNWFNESIAQYTESSWKAACIRINPIELYIIKTNVGLKLCLSLQAGVSWSRGNCRIDITTKDEAVKWSENRLKIVYFEIPESWGFLFASLHVPISVQIIILVTLCPIVAFSLLWFHSHNVTSDKFQFLISTTNVFVCGQHTYRIYILIYLWLACASQWRHRKQNLTWSVYFVASTELVFHCNYT
jgi:hypothetical protein